MDLQQMLSQELLTNIEGSLDLKTRVRCRGCGAKGQAVVREVGAPPQWWVSRVCDTLARG
jgi:hypothetical protein